MKKLLTLSLLALAFGATQNGYASVIRRVEAIAEPETQQELNEKTALERRLQIVNKINCFMNNLTEKYGDQIGMSKASDSVPTAFIGYFENPEFKPESDTPHYLYVHAKTPSEPVKLMKGKPAVFREMQNFAKQLEHKYPEIGFSCAGGTRQPKDVVFRFNNPDFKPGTPGSGKYCRIYMKS